MASNAMKTLFSICFLSLLAPILAAPAPKKELSVVYMLDKDTEESSILVWDRDYSTILGESCDSKVNTGRFVDHPLSFSTDGYGRGYVPKTKLLCYLN